MSTTTTNFDLFKYDTTADAQTAFSITNALNNNWDKLDANCVKRGSTTDATGSATKPVYVDASGQIQPCANEIPSGDFLTATTSLAENGYIKFSSMLLQCLTFLNTPRTLVITVFQFYILCTYLWRNLTKKLKPSLDFSCFVCKERLNNSIQKPQYSA